MQTAAPGAEPGAAGEQPCVDLDHVGVVFPSRRGPVEAVAEVSLSVRDREFLALLGPTGCGKSTLLRVVGDLIRPTSGRVEVRG